MRADSDSDERRPRWSRLAWVAIYALAMAWVEAAVVLYLRTLLGEYDPAQPARQELSQHLLRAECVREAATLIMLFAVGWLAGQTWRSRLAAVLVAFGIWDLGYYAFLAGLTGWPTGLGDWDILFLLPLPWWGPVWAPASVALLMMIGGAWVFLRDDARTSCWPTRSAVAAGATGAGIALLVFMSEALRQLAAGDLTPLGRLPERFETGWFLLALGLMTVPLLDLAWRCLPAGVPRGETPGQDP